MERNYVKRNVHLSLLGERLVQFFKEQRFRVRAVNEEKKGLFKIIVRSTHEHEITGKVTVLIQGCPNEFSVNFTAGALSQAFMKFGMLTSFLGGGSIFLRGIKSKDALERLERGFWVYVEEKIDFLVGSAGRMKRID